MLLINEVYKAPLSKEIKREFNKLTFIISDISPSLRKVKYKDATRGTISVADLIAYQIGWGKLVIGWYQAGLKGRIPQMPGEGFTKWDYSGLAKHFYKKYHFDGGIKQERELYKVVKKLLAIVEHEYQTKNLDKKGVWEWSTLSSGIKWPLSKWIRINTVAPYKRATTLIRKIKKFLDKN